MKSKLYSVSMWWAVIGYSLWMGGTFFSMAVVVPMWSDNPPTSVTEFFGGTIFNSTIYNFFGPPWMIARILPLVLLLITAAPNQRRWLFIPAGCMALMIIFTLVFVYPINTILMTHAGSGKTAVEIQKLTDTWILADRIRFAVGCIGYVFLLKVFRKS